MKTKEELRKKFNEAYEIEILRLAEFDLGTESLMDFIFDFFYSEIESANTPNTKVLTTCNGKGQSNGLCDTCFQPLQTSSIQCGRLIEVVAPSEEVKQGWISVKDRLPETHEGILGNTSKSVLAYRCHPVDQPDIEYYDKDSNRWSGDDEYDGQITHWMPLPKPPVLE